MFGGDFEDRVEPELVDQRRDLRAGQRLAPGRHEVAAAQDRGAGRDPVVQRVVGSDGDAPRRPQGGLRRRAAVAAVT